MNRGNLVIYDATGKIFSQTGEASGDITPHEYPVGIPWLEMPFGTMADKRLIAIDVTKTPHEPIFEDLPHVPTTDELIEQALDNYTQELIEGGLLV